MPRNCKLSYTVERSETDGVNPNAAIHKHMHSALTFAPTLTQPAHSIKVHCG